MPLPKVITQDLPLTPTTLPSRPNVVIPTPNPGSRLPLKKYKCAPNRHRSKCLPLEGRHHFSPLYPKTQVRRPGRAEAAPPPGGARIRPHLRWEKAAPGTRGWGARKNSAAPKPEGLHAPSAAGRGAPVTRPEGLRLLPPHRCGREGEAGPRPLLRPPRTQICARSSGPRGPGPAPLAQAARGRRVLIRALP